MLFQVDTESFELAWHHRACHIQVALSQSITIKHEHPRAKEDQSRSHDWSEQGHGCLRWILHSPCRNLERNRQAFAMSMMLHQCCRPSWYAIPIGVCEIADIAEMPLPLGWCGVMTCYDNLFFCWLPGLCHWVCHVQFTWNNSGLPSMCTSSDKCLIIGWKDYGHKEIPTHSSTFS